MQLISSSTYESKQIKTEFYTSPYVEKLIEYFDRPPTYNIELDLFNKDNIAHITYYKPNTRCTVKFQLYGLPAEIDYETSKEYIIEKYFSYGELKYIKNISKSEPINYDSFEDTCYSNPYSIKWELIEGFKFMFTIIQESVELKMSEEIQLYDKRMPDKYAIFHDMLMNYTNYGYAKYSYHLIGKIYEVVDNINLAIKYYDMSDALNNKYAMWDKYNMLIADSSNDEKKKMLERSASLNCPGAIYHLIHFNRSINQSFKETMQYVEQLSKCNDKIYRLPLTLTFSVKELLSVWKTINN